MSRPLSEILERISDAFVALDAEWRYTYVNRKAGELFGRDPESLVGKHIWTEFPEAWSEPFRELFERVMREQTPQHTEEYLAPWDRWFEKRLYPSPAGLSIFFTDITERKRAEALLEESAARFRLLVEGSPQPVMITTVGGRVAYANPAAARLLGAASPDELIGLSPDRVLHPGEREKARERGRRLLDGEEVGPATMRWTRLDGEEIQVEVITSRTTYEGELAFQTIARDVTEGLRARQLLHEQEAYFRSLIENSSDLIAVLEEDGTIRYQNPGSLRVMGYSPEEMVGRNAFDLVHPDDVPAIREAFARMMQLRGEAVSARLRLHHRDGSWRVVDSVGRNLLEDPIVRGIVINSRDVTERVWAEERLRASEERLSLALANTGHALWDWHLATRAVHFSESWAALYGYAPDEIGDPHSFWQEHLHPDDRERVLAAQRAHLAGSSPRFEVEYRTRHRNGHWIWIQDRGKVVERDAAGEAVRMVGLVSDVSERKRDEERLRESEERYRLVFRATNDVVWDWDVAAGRVRWSESIATRFGYDIPGRETDLAWWAERVHPEDRERVTATLERALQRGEEAWQEEFRFQRSNGSYAMVYVTCMIQRSGGAEPVRAIGSMQDLTARRAAEQELRALFSAMHDVILVLDRDGRYLKIAPTNPGLLFAPSEELLGKTLHDLLPRERADALLDPIHESLDQLRAVDFEYSMRIGDSERWFAATVSPMTEQTVIWVARDITERKEAEERLRGQEAWFRSLTQNTLDVITVLDEEGRIRYSTPSALRTLGYGAGELIGHDILEILHPEDQLSTAAVLSQLAGDGSAPITLTVRVRASDGSWRVHEAVAQSLLHDPAIGGIVVNSHDVTERRLLEMQLQQAQKMEAVGRLAGGVAHDFNNMLMAISGFASLLEAEVEPTGAAAQYLTEIYKATDRAAILTRQLLAFGRKQALHPKVVSLNQVVEQSGAMLRRLVRENVELVFRLDPTTGPCRVDPHQVEQVLMNLVVNAADAMPEGGDIEVATEPYLVTQREQRLHAYLPAGSYTSLTVRDNGHGMDPETLARVFEPFFTTKEVGKGTGLGLATVYGIVKQSGGYVWAESEPGVGSTFTMLLPRVAEDEEARKGDDVAGRGKMAAGSGTVLLAEDEDAVRLLARLALQKAGYAVIEARDGEEAIKIAEEHRGEIDLLLTDVIMPRVGGYVLARRLRARWPSLRVLYMSGYPGTYLGGTGPDSVGTEFVQKPFTPEALARKVREAIQQRAAGG